MPTSVPVHIPQRRHCEKLMFFPLLFSGLKEKENFCHKSLCTVATATVGTHAVFLSVL